jgi:hypothetical protein
MALNKTNYPHKFNISTNVVTHVLEQIREICKTTQYWLSQRMVLFIINNPIFLVLSHTFGYLEQKLLGRLWTSLVSLKSNFYVSQNFKFQCDPCSNKKDVSQRSSCRQYFSTKLGTSVDGHEKIITWKFHWNRRRNKWYRANIVKNLYYGKCTGKRDLTRQNVLFRQNMCQNLNFSLPKKLDLRKTKLSRSAQ